MMTQLTVVLLGLTFSLATAGCNSPLATGQTTAAQGQASTNPPATKVVKIVFVGKENACNCTRKTVDAGWATLQEALGTPPKLPVERLQIDTQGDKVEPYRQQKPLMTLPAIYFVDGNTTVLALLQGEVTKAQITSILKR